MPEAGVDPALLHCTPGQVADLGRMLVVPGFVDAHVHLGKAYQLSLLEQSGADTTPGLDRALTATLKARELAAPELVRANALKMPATMLSGGTVAARAHVEVAGSEIASHVQLHVDLARDFPDIALELVAFPQYGTEDRDLIRGLELAMATGCTVVAECPYADAGPRRPHGSAQPDARGHAHIRELQDAGALVALASNNYENAFTPVTTPSLTQVAWLAALTNCFSGTNEQWALYEAISPVPRRVLNIDCPGLEPGGKVGLVVFDAESAIDVVRQSQRPLAVATARRCGCSAQVAVGRDDNIRLNPSARTHLRSPRTTGPAL